MKELVQLITNRIQELGMYFTTCEDWGENGETAIFPEFGMSDLHHMGINLLPESQTEGWADWYNEGIIVVGN